MKKVLLLYICLWTEWCQLLYAQSYIFPVKTAGACYLAGNLGEIRQQHFHTGLDIGTLTGTPIRAAADGYVSRVRVHTSGYGKVIHITHPATRQQTVYAHLDGFSSPIDRVVRQTQYRQQSMEVDIAPPPNSLPIRAGEVIAYSGNTGSSAGPHLHYEIRTLDEVALNPFLFKFKELPTDNIPPSPIKIALVALNAHTKIQGTAARQEFSVQKINTSTYQVKNTINIQGEVGIEILAIDRALNSPHTFAINKLTLELDGRIIYQADLNRLDIARNRQMYLHVNYGVYRQQKQAFQKCYLAEGNTLPNYTHSRGGRIRLHDKKLHKAIVRLTDSWGNTSQVQLNLQQADNFTSYTFKPDRSANRARITHDVQGNLLIIKASFLKRNNIGKLYFHGIATSLVPQSSNGKSWVYVWDLRRGLPEYAEVDGVRYNFKFKAMIPPNRDYIYEVGNLSIFFPKTALADTLYLETQTGSNYVRLGEANTPLLDDIQVTYQPLAMPHNAKRYAFYADGWQLQRGEWLWRKYRFYTKQLGGFVFQADHTPPTIRLLKAEPTRVQFQVLDQQSGVKYIKATLNGKFLLMDYEPKANLIVSKAEAPHTSLKGTLRLEVRDGVGNVQVWQGNI